MMNKLAQTDANAVFTACEKGYISNSFAPYFSCDYLDQSSYQSVILYLRTCWIKKAIDVFHSLYGDESQVIMLGCGFSTYYWEMKKTHDFNFKKWIDVDHEEIIKKKKHIITNYDILKPLNNYHSISLNKNIDEMIDEIRKVISDDVPTLYIDDFELVHFDEDYSTKFVQMMTSKSEKNCFFMCGMTNLNDEVGKLLKELYASSFDNPIKLYYFTKSIDDAKNWINKTGFSSSCVRTFEYILSRLTEKSEKIRISQIEPFNDVVLIRSLLSHYSALAAGSADFTHLLGF